MLLIEKQGKKTLVRVRCNHCDSLVEARLKRQQKYGVVCRPCQDEMIEEIVADYLAQVVRGVPRGMRTTLFPIDPAIDDAWMTRMRHAVLAVDPKPLEIVRLTGEEWAQRKTSA